MPEKTIHSIRVVFENTPDVFEVIRDAIMFAVDGALASVNLAAVDGGGTTEIFHDTAIERGLPTCRITVCLTGAAPDTVGAACQKLIPDAVEPLLFDGVDCKVLIDRIS